MTVRVGDLLYLPTPASKPFPACRVLSFEATTISFNHFMHKSAKRPDGGSAFIDNGGTQA